MYNGYNPNYNNPYYNPNYNIQPSYGPQSYGTTKPTDNQLGQQSINTFQQPQILQGKQVESVDIVKNIEIPMDGSISYFPVADGSAIVSKQLQTDGTSKIQIYKLSKDTKEDLKYVTQEELRNILSDNLKNDAEYITHDDLKDALKGLHLNDIEDELKDIKKQLKKKGD